MDKYKRTEIEGIKYYGKHFILDAKLCNPNVLKKTEISRCIEEIVKKIDMVPYKELIIHRFGEGIEEGISAVQLIMTSSITVHTNDYSRDLYLDVFSCKWFDETIIVEIIDKIFEPFNINTTIILRK